MSTDYASLKKWRGLKHEAARLRRLRGALHRVNAASTSPALRPRLSPMTRPFSGTRMLDVTQVLAGPYSSYQRAQVGADVIKVERRNG